jgi:ribonuclease HI
VEREVRCEDGQPKMHCANCGHDARPKVHRKGGFVCGVCRVRLEGPKAKRRVVEEGRFFVNADASFVGGFAGIAYESAVIGSRRDQIQCLGNTAAEMHALLMAMEAAVGHERVTFRVDCTACAKSYKVSSQRRRANEEFAPLRERIARFLAANPGWRLVRVPRAKNSLAHSLALRARREALAAVAA